MADLILTGASRGIGRALALALAPTENRLILVARDQTRLESLLTELGPQQEHAECVAGDLSSIKEARALGRRLVEVSGEGATLVHNAGIWPSQLQRNDEGLESAFVTNHLAPLAMQESLIAARKLSRILVVSAGLIIKGRFDAQRTPRGDDFSGFRTYCSTKLCFAVAMRDVAARHPELDILVLHPGVVRTDLGARSGPLGWILQLVKRGWESPELCAARLARILAQPRWSSPGEARWRVEETEQPWPAVADAPELRRAVNEVSAKLLVER